MKVALIRELGYWCIWPDKNSNPGTGGSWGWVEKQGTGGFKRNNTASGGWNSLYGLRVAIDLSNTIKTTGYYTSGAIIGWEIH